MSVVDRPSLDHAESREEYLFACLLSAFEGTGHGESIAGDLLRRGCARLKGDELQIRCDGFWPAVPADCCAKFTIADKEPAPLSFFLDGCLRPDVRWTVDQPRTTIVVLEECPLKGPLEAKGLSECIIGRIRRGRLRLGWEAAFEVCQGQIV